MAAIKALALVERANDVMRQKRPATLPPEAFYNELIRHAPVWKPHNGCCAHLHAAVLLKRKQQICIWCHMLTAVVELLCGWVLRVVHISSTAVKSGGSSSHGKLQQRSDVRHSGPRSEKLNVEDHFIMWQTSQFPRGLTSLTL
jgi:hypothetical protein